MWDCRAGVDEQELTVLPRRGSIVFAGGGTAGHLMPAIAVADYLVSTGVDRESIAFVGSRRGLETRLVPEAGFGLTALTGRGIRRSLSISNLGAGLGLIWAFLVSFKAVLLKRPRVVVSTGGYAALPYSLAAGILRVPLVVIEPNAVAGAANRVLGRLATKSVVSSSNTGLAGAENLGIPVRKSVVERVNEAVKAERRAEAGFLSTDSVVGVVGGSLGARQLNQGVEEYFASVVLGSAELGQQWCVYQVTGAADFERLVARREEILSSDPGLSRCWQIAEFEHDMGGFYAMCDVVVSRAGASTYAELVATRSRSVVVPLANTPGDHQALNAKALVDAGLAIQANPSDPGWFGTSLAAVSARWQSPLVDQDSPDATRSVGALIRRLALLDD